MDFFVRGGAGAESRAKAKMYEEVADYLEGKISELESSIDLVENALIAQDETFQSNEDSAQGMIITTFDLKEESVWKPQYERIIFGMRQGVLSLTYRKTAARQLQAYWENCAKLEEAKARARV